MNEKTKGWIIMILGICILLSISFVADTFKSFGTIGGVGGLLICFGVGIPMILIGSIMTGGAPDFLINRYKGSSPRTREEKLK